MLEIVTASAVALAAVLLLTAALHDLAWRTVPNWLPAVLALDGILLRLLSGQLLEGIVTGLAVFVAAAFLWRCRLMGGGDVKLLGAAAIAVPSGLAVPFILVVVLAGGALALAYLALRHVVAAPLPVSFGAARRGGFLARIARVERRRIRQCRSLPYACAIATGALFILAGG